MKLSFRDFKLLHSILNDVDKNESDRYYKKKVCDSINKLLVYQRINPTEKAVLCGYIYSNYLFDSRYELSLNDFMIYHSNYDIKSKLINLNDYVVLYQKIYKKKIHIPEATFSLIEQVNRADELLISLNSSGIYKAAIIIDGQNCIYFQGVNSFNALRFNVVKLSKVKTYFMRQISRIEATKMLEEYQGNIFSNSLYKFLTA